jgi:transcriptional regulator with XRE-family HTH domain
MAISPGTKIIPKNNVEKARVEAGLTRTQVSARLGMPANSLKRLEQSDRKFDAFELYTLSRILNKPMHYLLALPRLCGEDQDV